MIGSQSEIDGRIRVSAWLGGFAELELTAVDIVISVSCCFWFTTIKIGFSFCLAAVTAPPQFRDLSAFTKVFPRFRGRKPTHDSNSLRFGFA